MLCLIIAQTKFTCLDRKATAWRIGHDRTSDANAGRLASAFGQSTYLWRPRNGEWGGTRYRKQHGEVGQFPSYCMSTYHKNSLGTNVGGPFRLTPSRRMCCDVRAGSREPVRRVRPNTIIVRFLLCVDVQIEVKLS